MLGWFADCRVRLWLATGELDQASYWAESSGLSVGDEFSFHYDLHHVNLARVLVAQVQQNTKASDPVQCLGLLDRLLVTIDDMGWVHHKIQVLILRAMLLQATRDQVSALEALESALSLAEPERYIRTFIGEGPSMERLLSKLAKRSAIRGYVAELLQAFPSDTANQQSGLVEPLSPREMEVLRLLTTSLSVTDIAGELIISVNTARSHIKNIYSKLGVNRRLDAIEKAKELNLTS